jgi:ABC-type sugar transport system substrate-binding protein
MSPRLALFLINTQDYSELLRDEFLATGQAYGFEVRVFFADNDPAKQVAQIEACLAEPEGVRPGVLLVHPVREVVLVSIAHRAVRLGLGWILLNRWSDYILDLQGEFPKLPIFSVNPDQQEIGRIQARQFMSLLPNGGEIVYIRGPLGTSSTRRLEGVQEVLHDFPIQLFSINSDWTTHGGELAMNEWLRIFQGKRFPNFMVGAQNDAMSIGAKMAFLEEARRRPDFDRKIHFTGCDGSPKFGRRLVEEGKLTSTIVVPPTTGRAVTEIASMLSGGQRPAADINLPVSSFPDLAQLRPRESMRAIAARSTRPPSRGPG